MNTEISNVAVWTFAPAGVCSLHSGDPFVDRQSMFEIVDGWRWAEPWALLSGGDPLRGMLCGRQQER
jgi:hypothetical protein